MIHPSRHSIHHDEALAQLRSGNSRFVQNVRCVVALASQYRRDALVALATQAATRAMAANSAAR